MENVVKENKMRSDCRINRIGETKISRFGSKMTIIEYNRNMDIWIKFEDGYKTHTNYPAFQKGYVKNPYDKSVFGIGYFGEGKYTAKLNNKATSCYTLWHNMLRRCYVLKDMHTHPTYENCTVCEEWLNFQNFATWYEENFYQITNEKMAIDKDIVIKGNKIYSPETCVFVSQRINNFHLRRGRV